MIDEERFWKKVDKSGPNGCWNWTAYRNKKGYGQFKFGCSTVPAHRVSYALVHGWPVVDWLVCHKCDNPSCVNPDHLFAGTVRDNAIDMARKGRGGSRWGGQKLAVPDVICIKARLQRGAKPAPLAREYGVSIFTICKIKDGKIWKHVEAA